MGVFQYPKGKYKRTQTPRKFKRYQTYKRYLQHEFSRVCVYCRQPDSSAPNLNFGVDHYRPKGVPRFSALVNEYSNLYYCCGNCNSAKNAYWPADEAKDPFVVNPCDHEMAKHLRFDAETGRVESQSPHGTHTVELLLLNATDVVKFRRSTVFLVGLLQREILEQQDLLNGILKLLRQGKMSTEEAAKESEEINQAIRETQSLLQAHTGEQPLSPLRKQRFNVAL